MSVFFMFVASPPAGTPVASVYREGQPFGPFISGGQAMFSPEIEIQIAESAPPAFRNVRAVCRGQVRVLGVHSIFDDQDTPVTLELDPFFTELGQLARICRNARIETPVALVYSGIRLGSLISQLSATIAAAPNPENEAIDSRVGQFLAGGPGVSVNGGAVIGEVSVLTMASGDPTLGFGARTGPQSFLDPVVLYRYLAADAGSMAPEETTNSWLQIATRDRVLISIRDEWNEPVISDSEVVTVTGGGTSLVAPLTDPGGTVAVPPAWGNYTVHLEGRRLTSRGSQATPNQLALTATAPAHLVVSAIRPQDWFHAPDPTSVTKPLNTLTYGNIVEPLIDGNEYFARLVEDLRVDNPIHVYMQGWGTAHDFRLLPTDPKSTLGSLLQAVSAADGVIRVMTWRAPVSIVSTNSHVFFETLSGTESILDAHTHHAPNFTVDNYVIAAAMGSYAFTAPPVSQVFLLWVYYQVDHIGAHHTKCFVIRNAQGDVAHWEASTSIRIASITVIIGRATRTTTRSAESSAPLCRKWRKSSSTAGMTTRTRRTRLLRCRCRRRTQADQAPAWSRSHARMGQAHKLMLPRATGRSGRH